VRVKGSHFNRLLTGSLRYTDSATGGLESTARVRLEVTPKWGEKVRYAPS
jgi:hypothetical protein